MSSEGGCLCNPASPEEVGFLCSSMLPGSLSSFSYSVRQDDGHAGQPTSPPLSTGTLVCPLCWWMQIASCLLAVPLSLPSLGFQRGVGAQSLVPTTWRDTNPRLPAPCQSSSSSIEERGKQPLPHRLWADRDYSEHSNKSVSSKISTSLSCAWSFNYPLPGGGLQEILN